jgi:NitT/TauT family transport system substrate-binding protein
VTVRVGYFPNVTHAPAVLGFATGEHAFATALGAGAKLETKVFNAGPSAMEALHASAIDLAFVGPTPAINAFARGGDLAIIANVANGGSVLVARNDSGIAKVADLEGKRIAVPQLGNTQDAMLRHLLAQANIKLKDQGGNTTILPVENPNVQSLFTTGQLDAACVPEPWGARLETESGALVVLDWKPIWRDGDYPVTVLVARKAFLDQHREIVKSFVEALQTLTDRLSAKSEADVAALNAELKVLTGKELKPEVISKALGRIEFTTRLNPEALQAMAEVMHEVGYAKTAPDVTGLIDSSLLPSQGKGAPRGK